MSKLEEIKELYFNKQYKQKEISDMLNVSKKYVSKILLQDNRYKKEKERRKELSKQKHKEKTINYIKSKRKIKRIDIAYEQLKQMHIQASKELSGQRNINNRTYKKWNSSIYRYNERTKAYHLKKGIVVGADVPKKISWKSY